MTNSLNQLRLLRLRLAVRRAHDSATKDGAPLATCLPSDLAWLLRWYDDAHRVAVPAEDAGQWPVAPE
jgi:hypothetical protein